MNIGLWLERCGRSHPEAPAVGYGDDLVLRYGELALRAAQLAGALRDRYGIVPGARVAIIAKNCPSCRTLGKLAIAQHQVIAVTNRRCLRV